jgi:hypothetical protein
MVTSFTAIEANAIIVSDDRIFQTIKEFYPSLRVENWKETAADGEEKGEKAPGEKPSHGTENENIGAR